MAFQFLQNMPLDEAKTLYLTTLLDHGFAPAEETIPVGEALGRITSRAVYAHICAPHYHASAMDGIAVRAADTFGATETTPVVLPPSQFQVLDTGDPIPEGCDAVIMVEDVVYEEDGSARLYAPAAPWQHIRQIGEDVCAGEMLLPSRTAVTPAAMGAQMTVTFNAGGSGTIWDGEESLACTWVQNGSTATVTEQDGYTWTFVMQADGTISVDVDGITLFMARQGGAALPSTMPPAVGGQTVTGNGFTLQVPQGWMELNEATLQQLIQTNGQAAVDAAGLSQQLQYTQSMGILLYYSADLNANMNVAQESAQGITMDTLPTLEADYAAAYASMGITNYDMAGPVEFSGRTYYTGTYDAVYPTMQYYYIVNNVFYTITLTNVSDADAAMILGSFTANQ